MNLIKKGESQNEVVDARALHSELKSKQDFSNWIKNKVVNNLFFTENEDYVIYNNAIDTSVHQVKAGKQRIDYALTLETAKKVAMAEQTKKGNEVRDYFITVEKERNVLVEQFAIPQSFAEALALAGELEKEREILSIENKQQSIALREQKPIVENYNDISNSSKLSTVDEVSTLVGLGRNTFYKWLYGEKYLKNISKKGRRYKPSQKMITQKLMDYKITEFYDGKVDKLRKNYAVLITGKGILYFKQAHKEYIKRINIETDKQLKLDF